MSVPILRGSSNISFTVLSSYSFPVSSLSPTPNAGDVVIISLYDTVDTGITGITLSDDGGGGAWHNVTGFVTIGPSNVFGSWWKQWTGAETHINAAITGATNPQAFGLAAVAGPFTGGAILDPGWVDSSNTVFQGSAGGGSPTPQLSPISAGDSFLASGEFIYSLSFQIKGNGGNLAWTRFGAAPLLTPSSLTNQISDAWANNVIPFSQTDGYTVDWATARSGVTYAISFFDSGPAINHPRGGGVIAGGGAGFVTISIPDTGPLKIAGCITIDGVGQDNVVVSAYRRNRFATEPREFDPVPDSNPPDSQGITNRNQFGSPGAFRIPIEVVDDYFLCAVVDSHNEWFEVPSGAILGRPVIDLSLSHQTDDLGGVAIGFATSGLNPTQGTPIDHVHNLSTAAVRKGGVWVEGGAGVLTRQFPTSVADVLQGTLDGNGDLTAAFGPPIGRISEVTIASAATLPASPGVFPLDGRAGGFDLQLQPTNAVIAGVYELPRIEEDDTANYIRFVPPAGQTIGGMDWFGSTHGDVALYPDQTTGLWRVMRHPDALATQRLNAKGLAGNPYGTAGGYSMLASPGPYPGEVGQTATLSAVNTYTSAWNTAMGDTQNWTAILTVGNGGPNDFQFIGTDIMNTDNGGPTPTVRGTNGLSGGCFPAAVGLAGSSRNPTGVIPDLAPNQAFVIGKANPSNNFGNPAMSGSGGQITFDNRQVFIDMQFQSGGSLMVPPYDGRYAFAQGVVPPSGIIRVDCQADIGLSTISSTPVGHWSGKPVFWQPFFVFDDDPIQQIHAGKSTQQKTLVYTGITTATGANGANTDDPLITSTPNKHQFWIVSGTAVSGGVQPLPPGHKFRCYWMIGCNDTTQSSFGDNLSWTLENVPLSLDVHCCAPGNMNGP